MKKHYLIGLLALLFCGAVYSQSDNIQNIITEDEKILEATTYCVDVQFQVAPYNEFALEFISIEGFPKKTTSSTKQELHNLIDSYFRKNTELVDKVRNARKESHDKLYGPRPY